jgi:hypothetical protein
MLTPSAWMSDCGSAPGERMNTTGVAGEEEAKMRA